MITINDNDVVNTIVDYIGKYSEAQQLLIRAGSLGLCDLHHWDSYGQEVVVGIGRFIKTRVNNSQTLRTTFIQELSDAMSLGRECRQQVVRLGEWCGDLSYGVFKESDPSKYEGLKTLIRNIEQYRRDNGS